MVQKKPFSRIIIRSSLPLISPFFSLHAVMNCLREEEEEAAFLLLDISILSNLDP